jgi:hypothetical protein
MEATAHVLDLTPPQSDNPVFALAKLYKSLKERKDVMEEAMKALNKQIEAAEEQLANEMITEENSKFTLAGKTFYLTEKLYVNSLSDMKDDLYKSLRANGFGDMVKDYVQPSTLKGLVKEQLAESESDELPAWLDGYVTWFKKPAIGMRTA